MLSYSFKKKITMGSPFIQYVYMDGGEICKKQGKLAVTTLHLRMTFIRNITL